MTQATAMDKHIMDPKLATINLLTQVLKPFLDGFLSPGILRILVPILILAAIVWFLRLRIVKGWIGEGVVNLGLKLRLDKRRYHLLKNVTLPCDDDDTTQIDHIIVSIFGIFVIETKNMRGWIFGSEHEARWTQKFRRSCYTFQNPLRQNYKHVAVLAELLDVPPDSFISVIMFIGDAKLKTRDSLPPNVVDRGLVPFIKSRREPILTDAQVQRVLQAIASGRLAQGLRTHVRHVQNVRKTVEAKRIPSAVVSQPLPVTDLRASPEAQVPAPPVKPPTCPKCGRTMVRRTAKSGNYAGNEFWGCPGFPRCRAVVNKSQ